MALPEDIITIGELSDHLKVHPTTIYRLLREGRVPGFRVGSAWRFSRAAIEKWETGQWMPEEDKPATPPRPRKKPRKPRK
ncbi:MAG TPA: helix-turn-helix domain-containing protein [Candidatus Binataceae bacterium]|nr:helix-turn-helix domain-containing protein [Candidatus Binataceae bacterium]